MRRLFKGDISSGPNGSCSDCERGASMPRLLQHQGREVSLLGMDSLAPEQVGTGEPGDSWLPHTWAALAHAPTSLPLSVAHAAAQGSEQDPALRSWAPRTMSQYKPLSFLNYPGAKALPHNGKQTRTASGLNQPQGSEVSHCRDPQASRWEMGSTQL